MGVGGSSTDDLFVVFGTQLQHDTIQNIKIDIIDQLTTTNTATVTVKLVFLDKNNNIVFIVNENTQVVSYTANTDNVRRITINNVNIPAFQKIAVQVKYTNVPTFQTIAINQISLITDILKVCHAPTMPIIDTYRASNIFKQVVYHYSGSATNESLRNRNILHAFSQSLGLYYSQSLITAPYMDDFFDQTDNLIFNGSRISAPNININSTISAIGNTPIIEVYNTNPNQLIFTQNPGNNLGGSLETGNLIVR